MEIKNARLSAQNSYNPASKKNDCGYTASYIRQASARQATRYFVSEGQDGKKICPPPLNIFRGGGGKKNVYYTQTINKLTLPTGYSVSRNI